MKKCCDKKIPERLNKVGGQAVLEGVMMKAGDRTVTTCRKEDGTLVVTDAKFTSVKKKHKILGIPILRGIIGFIESLVLSMKTLNASAEALGIDEETEDGKFAKWLKKHLGISVTDALMVIATILGVALSLFLFIFLPTLVTNVLKWLWSDVLAIGDIHPSVLAVIEGLVKVGIFLLYLVLVSLMPDIKRTFMYHGAEHKSIACFESGDELTPENAMKHKRFHPRCGTSFMFLMILLGIFAGMFVRNILPEDAPSIIIALVRLALLPLIMGIGYEILMLAGKRDNLFTRIISAPGMWVQRITTKEPTEDMLEVAITSIKCALREDFPEFYEFYKARAWEKSAENSDSVSAEEQASAAASCNSEQAEAANRNGEQTEAEILNIEQVETAAAGYDNERPDAEATACNEQADDTVKESDKCENEA